VNVRDALALVVLENGAPWLRSAEVWQREDLLAALEGDQPYNFLTRSRGSSKTTDLAAGCVAVLATADRPLRLYWLAADRDQGKLALDAIDGFLRRTPALAGRVSLTAKGATGANGAQLEILPADAPSAWGLNPHFVFCDELANWADAPGARRLWEAVSSAAAKRADCRMVVLTTPSTPDHWSYTEVLEPARRSGLWRVSERRGPPPWMSEEKLREQRERLPDSVFRQLFLGEWTASEGSFLEPDAVDRAFTLDGPRGADRSRFLYVSSLDLGSVHDRTAFAVGHREGPVVHLDWLATWQGSRGRPVDFSSVEQSIVAAHEAYGFGAMSYDRWQALDLTQRLTKRGVPCREFVFTRPNKMRLAQTLLSLLNGGHLALYAAAGLKEELLGLRLVQASDGTWAFDHRPGGHDDMAIAVSMMAVRALEGAERGVQCRSVMLGGGVPITHGIAAERY
jgi:hypothetical protein